MVRTHKKPRVVICNRYSLFRAGIKALLQEQSAFVIVGESGTARGAVKQVERLRPDVVLMGEAAPDWSSAEATRCIKAIDPDVKVLVLTLNDDADLLSGCLEAGASGYIGRDDDASQLRSAIGAVCSNQGLKAFVA